MRTGKGRITVTLDRALIEAANAAVKEGRADSVSAWINDGLAEHAENERRLAVMAELIREYEAEHGAFTPEQLAERERLDRRNALVIRGSRNVRRTRSR
jgi:hypothetical protein